MSRYCRRGLLCAATGLLFGIVVVLVSIWPIFFGNQRYCWMDSCSNMTLSEFLFTPDGIALLLMSILFGVAIFFVAITIFILGPAVLMAYREKMLIRCTLLAFSSLFIVTVCTAFVAFCLFFMFAPLSWIG